MLLQIHHQFKDKTEMIAQIESKSPNEVSHKIKELNITHPLPIGAQWMICNEKSEHFVKTALLKKEK